MRIDSNLLMNLYLLNQLSAQQQTISTPTKFSDVLASRQQNFSGSVSAASLSSGSQNMEEMFARASQVTGVPVDLLKAVAKTESDFDPNCVSSAGAMGIMQLMPCNVEEYGVTDPFDPEQNIMAGAMQLADLSRRYDGDLTLTLAAYNAGMGNVAKYGGVPPFEETQNYVRKVSNLLGQDISIPTNDYNTIPQTANGLNSIVSQNDLIQDQMQQLIYMLAQSLKYNSLSTLNGWDNTNDSSMMWF